MIMLTDNSTSECTRPNNHDDLSLDQPDSDNPLAAAFAREVKFSQPQQLTQPHQDNGATLASSPGNHLIHHREPQLYSAFGEQTVKHNRSRTRHGKATTPDRTAKSIELMEFIQTSIYEQPHQTTPELSASVEILMQSGAPKELLRVILSSVIAVESFYRRLSSFRYEEDLDPLKAQSAYFKSKISDRLGKLMDIVKTYDFLFNNANNVIEAYNMLKLEQISYYQLLQKSLFLSEQMGEVILIIATHYLEIQFLVGTIINDPAMPLYRLPTLMKPFLSSSIMNLECMVECRLRDLDATSNIAARKPGIKKMPRKYSGIRHAPQPKLSEPRFEQSQLNHSLYNLSRSIATVELFTRSRAKPQMDILDHARQRLFELIDRYTTEASITIAEMLVIPGCSIIEKYLAYAELLHAAEAAPEKHLETKEAVLEKITYLATMNEAAAKTEGSNSSCHENLRQFLAQDKTHCQTWRRYPLSDHILLGIEAICTALNRQIELATFQKQRTLDIHAEKLQGELYNLDSWINHLRATGLIDDAALRACASYCQLNLVREALLEVTRTHKATLETAFEEASKCITLGQTKATAAQPAAELSSPCESTLFTNSDLLKTINHFLFANGELTINAWNQQQGQELAQLLSKKQQSAHTRSLIAFTECCQHEETINEHIKKYRMAFILIYPYVTSIPAMQSQQFNEGKIKSFHEQIARFNKLNKKIQSELQEWQKKIIKIKLKSDDPYEGLKQGLVTAAQSALKLSTEQQRHLNIGLDLMLEKRRQILISDFPNLYSLEKHIYDVSTKKIKSQIKSTKRKSKASDAPSSPAPDRHNQPDKADFFITTPLPGLGFTLDNSPPLNSLKIPCLESARDDGLTGERLLDQLSQQLHIQVAAYQSVNRDFYSPPPSEPACTKSYKGQISFSHFLAGTRIRLDNPTTIKQRDVFHQHIASQVAALLHSKTPVVYMGSRAWQMQLQQLWGSQALEHLETLSLPKLDPAVARRATTPRDTDLLILNKEQLATVKEKMHDTLLSAAQKNPDLPVDVEITTTDERTEIFYGTTCLTCNLILHKSGCRQPKYWFYVVDLITCVDSGQTPLHAFDSCQLPSGEITHCRRLDTIIMDELNLIISMAAGPARALMAMIRISTLAALEAATPKLDNTTRLALIFALDTAHHHFPDPVFAQQAATLRSRTFTVVDHKGQLLGVKPPFAADQA